MPELVQPIIVMLALPSPSSRARAVIGVVVAVASRARTAVVDPGASLLGPLAIPTQSVSAVLVAGGVPRRRVLLWQAVAIAVWTTIAAVAAVSAWAALTYAIES